MMDKVISTLNSLTKYLEKKFRKDISYPYQFALVKQNQIARSKGIKDDENKIIEYYKAGRLLKTYPYSEAVIKTLRSDEIPVVDEDFEMEQEFDWGVPITEMGVVKLRR